MAYEKTIWKNNSEPALDAEHLNKIENGIANSAPGGFGLGGNAKILTASDDLNTVWQAGWYAWDTAPQNAPTVSGQPIADCSALVLNKGGDSNRHQIVYTLEGYELHRSISDETIGEWEWVNPPMLTSVEYRTTERYNGKAVYKMLDADGLVKWRADGEESWHYGGGLTYVVGEPVTFTLPKWDAANEGTTPFHGLQAEGYKIGANGVQLGLPSDSSVVNTQAMIETALTIVRTEVAAPKPSEGECGRTYIDLSAVNAPSRDLTVAIFGLEEAERVTVTEPAIGGVTAPVVGETPVTAITEGKQFTGTVTWSPDLVDGKFGPQTVYTATITLTPKVGYKLDGVAANFFTVAGATSVSNQANSGVVTAVFPATKEAAT